MIINYSDDEELYPHSICTMKQINIENVKKFKYLGCQIDFKQSGLGQSEISNRINSANSAFQQHKYLLRNFHISLKTRVKFLNSFVRTRLTYGCQCWSCTKAISQKFDSCYRQMLRKMIWRGFERFEKDNDFSYKICNIQLHKICKTEDVSTFIQQQQTKYLAHTIRRPNNTATKQLTFESCKRTKKGRKPNTLTSNVVQSNQIKFYSLL